MSLLSPLSQLASTTFAAIKSSTTIKAYLLVAAVLAGLGGTLWWYVSGLKDTVESQKSTIDTQGKTISQQQANLTALSGDRDEAIRQRDESRLKTKQLSSENEKNVQKLQQARQRAEEFEKQVATLQHDNPCAASFLPDGIARMLNEDAKQFNDQYRGTEGSQGAGKTAESRNVPPSGRH